MSDDDATQRIEDGRAWDDFCERLQEAGHKALAAAPDDSAGPTSVATICSGPVDSRAQ